MVGLPLADLRDARIPDFGICEEIFAHHVYYSAEKLFRAVPEFRPRISLEAGMRQVIPMMERDGRIPDSDRIEWEDRVIAAHRQMRAALSKIEENIK
ncbi:MAG TPA: hypothetical protein VI547_03165 [Anaerolineales bacterium]|nr:hypothetical protein [Anaerolineales bacterium]